VKNHDFTPKNHIFSNCEGRRENFWGISCEKSPFYAKKSYFFLILGGGARRVRPPPLNPPLHFKVSVANGYIVNDCRITSVCPTNVLLFNNIAWDFF
jgi:hypothetical protein